MAGEFQVGGRNAAAPFTLKLHRGDGMLLVAMDWKTAEPPNDFVGFAIEYQEPNGTRFFAVKNRLGFPGADGKVDPTRLSTLQSPIQKFRWVHFPRNAELAGEFVYRVTPVFMNDQNELSYGPAQDAAIELRRETYPGQLNVTFTRGFVSSQAFVDNYGNNGDISTLLPAKADDGLDFIPTHPKAKAALDWMGFEARNAILEVLDQALADGAQVRVAAYDLSERDVVAKLQALGPRLEIIIDDSGTHGAPGSAETEAAKRLSVSAGADKVKRQHMGGLQHNKIIVVDGPTVKKAVCGSTNFSWRGFFVQANNAVVLEGPGPVAAFKAAFDAYWAHDDVAGFGATPAAVWTDLGLAGIDIHAAFSPHAAGNALLASIAKDLKTTRSSLFYSLAFLYQTPGPILDAINTVTLKPGVYVNGVSDRKMGKKVGVALTNPDGAVTIVSPSALTKNVPEPFKSEPTGGGGVRMHHKFAVIDFDKPTARVYLGSYNFSSAADVKNGENLIVIRDRRVAVSYMVEALRIFDHYRFRVAQDEAKAAKTRLMLKRPPRAPGETPWWREDYSDPLKIRDRELFA